MTNPKRYTERHIYGDGVSEAADGEFVRWEDYERLQKLIHDTGATFTGGHENCSTCRKAYNVLADSQGWAKLPDEPKAPLTWDSIRRRQS